MPKNVIFVARYRQYRVRMEIPASAQVDTPENRGKLLDRLGRMMVNGVESEVIFTTE